MIYKTSSLLTAMRIADLVQNDERMREAHGYIESYQNGREQGLILFKSHYQTFYLCEHRNSDGPTVYFGTYSMQSISEDAYQDSHAFHTCEEAAEWIIETWSVLID